jgi:hypothetical protein
LQVEIWSEFNKYLPNFELNDILNRF